MFKDIIGKYLYKAGFTPEQVQRCKITMQEEYADMNGCLTDDRKINWKSLCRECGIEYNPAEDYTDWNGWECVFSDRLSDYEEDVTGLKAFISGYCGECTIEQAENMRKLISQMWEEARKE